VTHSEDQHGIVLQLEEDPVLANTGAERASEFTVQGPHISGTGRPHGSFPVERSNIGPGHFEPLDLIRRHLLVRCQIRSADAEFREDLVHGDASATALFQPSLALSNAPSVVVGDGLIIRGSGDGHWNGIEHGFEQTVNRSNLTGRQAVYQFVHLLLLLENVGRHEK
jgi:hypothetical protein